MVPFQFDLIQLLPKCQQVELFFLTFGTGIILFSFTEKCKAVVYFCT